MDRNELNRILLSQDVDHELEVLQQSGILRRVFPVVQTLVGFGGGDTGHKCLWSHTKQVVKQTTPDVLLRLASLFHDVGKPTTITHYLNGEIGFPLHESVGARLFEKNLRAVGLISEDDIEFVSFIIQNLGRVEAYTDGWTDSSVRRLSTLLGHMSDSVLAVAEADCTTSRPEKRAAQLHRVGQLRDRITALRTVDALPPALPKGLGIALSAHLGLELGPKLGALMIDLKKRVELGELPRNANFEVYVAACDKYNS